MKNLKFKNSLFCFLLVCLLVTTLSACKSSSVVLPTATTENTTNKIITIVKRDTVFETKQDSSYYKAYLSCVNGKVVFDQNTKAETKAGNHVQPPKVIIKDNILTIDCHVEAQKLLAQWKETYIKEHASTIKKIPYPVPIALTYWQQTQIVLGRLLLALVALLGVGLLYRNRN